MSPFQPVSRVVNVGVNLTPNAAQSQALSALLFLGTSPIIDTTERVRTYASLAAIATDFGTNAEEYKAATRWFGQSPQPASMLVARFVNSASKGGLKCGTLSAAQQQLAAWTGITTGAFKIVKDGAAAVAVSALNFSGAATMSAIAALIQAGTGFPAGVTCTWNATYGRFEFESGTAGATSGVGFLQAPATGTDITAQLLSRSALDGAYTYAGQAAETAPAALAVLDDLVGQKFYGVGIGGLVPGANGTTDNDAIIALAAAIEASGQKRTLWLTTGEAGAISSVSTTDLAYRLKQLAYRRTFIQYSPGDAYAAISAAARILPVNYEGSRTAITLKFKQQPGIPPVALAVSQALAVEGKNCNVFISYENDTNILEQGVMSSGDFTDTITGADWLATTIQRDVWNLLYSNTTKVPQTDEGANLVQAAVEARCIQAVNCGYAAPGVWNAGGFGILNQGDFLQKGYYVYVAPIRLQSQADRAARKCPPVQVAIKLAGAIHSADVTVNINQ